MQITPCYVACYEHSPGKGRGQALPGRLDFRTNSASPKHRARPRWAYPAVVCSTGERTANAPEHKYPAFLNEGTLSALENRPRTRRMGRLVLSKPADDKVAYLTDPAPNTNEPELVELKKPLVAAGLACLLPGLGHLYQRRYAKGVLFMVCILSTYFFGWSIGGGKVVFAQWNPNAGIFDQRWHYVGQFWVGLPAWPALIQTMDSRPLGDNFMVAPELPGPRGFPGEQADWIEEFNRSFEMGTVYTLIAGILNLLVIFDAAGGPIGAVMEEELEKKKSPKTKDGREPDLATSGGGAKA